MTVKNWLLSLNRTALAGPIIFYTFAPISADAQTGWTGVSNASGGIARYGYQLQPSDPGFNPEMAENEWMTVRCDGFDGRISISFGTEVDPADADKHNVIFEIDGDRFERRGPIDEGGLYPGSPIAMLEAGDPVLETMMAGHSMRLHVGTERSEPLMTISLSGTRNTFNRHLQGCLNRRSSEIDNNNISPNEFIQNITQGGCIDNNALVEICKSGPDLIQTHQDYISTGGLPVCVSFKVDELLRKDRRIEGTFSGNSGAWSQEIFVAAVFSSGLEIATLGRGDKVQARGYLPQEGTAFYGNLIDNCFIEFEADFMQNGGF